MFSIPYYAPQILLLLPRPLPPLPVLRLLFLSPPPQSLNLEPCDWNLDSEATQSSGKPENPKSKTPTLAPMRGTLATTGAAAFSREEV